MKLHLPNGATGFTNDAGKWICTGSQMGRRNTLPENSSAPVKLSIQRLKMVDGDYDTGGAYWGSSSQNAGDMYCAFAYKPSQVSIMANFAACVFVRAHSRQQAKQKVREQISGATFYH